ncbi:hypothetical protein [Kalamiella sp. sgz302252]|uniref:hypothetical protein n=1 Tax=Pantoea sp. sgz302252 TaxID=3341827 RepID=UPI0036D2AACB
MMLKDKIPTVIFIGSLIACAFFLLLSRDSINSYKAALPALTVDKPGNLIFSIDYCNIEPRFSLIAGWAGLSNGDINVVTKIYRVDTQGNLYQIHKTTIRRPDIVEARKNAAFSHAGFVASAINASNTNMTNRFVIELEKNGQKNMVTYECK